MSRTAALGCLLLGLLGAAPALAGGSGEASTEGEASALSTEVVPPRTDLVVDRPNLLIEWGPDFLGRGPLAPGFKMPGGATWQPALWVFGAFRTAVQHREDDGLSHSEFANDLALFANLRLTGTERVLLGFTPLFDDGRFTGHVFDSDIAPEGWHEEANLDLSTFFFEGDLGEMFPALGKSYTRPNDIGFAFGRQPLFFQNGMLINDTMDALGVVKNNLQPDDVSNLRITWLWAFNDIDHGAPNPAFKFDQDDGQLLGIFTEIDLAATVLAIDVAWLNGPEEIGDGLWLGVSALQRLGRWSTSFSVNACLSLEDPTAPTVAVDDGVLVFVETSMTPHGTHDNVYVNGWVVEGTYRQAARGPASSGPLGRAGILFEAAGLGSFGSALSSDAKDSIGAVVGWQRFFSDTRRQLVLEIGGRVDTDGSERSEVGVGARFQQAFRQHYVFRADAFYAGREGAGPSWGVRSELLVKF